MYTAAAQGEHGHVGREASKPSARIFSLSVVAPFIESPRSSPSATTFQAEGLVFPIQSGRYIGDLPRRYAAIWGEHGWMRPLAPERFSREADFHVITRNGPEPTPVLRAFLEELGG